jgi:hypothetical protein
MLPGARAASSLAAPAPITNRGARATWQYAGIVYRVTSNQCINGLQVFLPVIVKSAP